MSTEIELFDILGRRLNVILGKRRKNTNWEKIKIVIRDRIADLSLNKILAFATEYGFRLYRDGFLIGTGYTLEL